MASPEVEIYKSVKRFSDYLKDSVSTSVINKMQGMNTDIPESEMNEIARIIDITFEQCSMHGFREVESTVKIALENSSKKRNARR